MPGPKDFRERFSRPSHTRGEPDPWEGFVDQRDSSLASVYLSLIPFLISEYYCELRFDRLPSGLVFPIGFLLFWAFYYTYYKPDFLEEHLNSQPAWNPTSIARVGFGVLVWFFRITVVELLHWIALRWVIRRPVKKAPSLSLVRKKEKQKSNVQGIPAELVRSLETLGLTGSPSWSEIHHRYRELAKRFHPDLNPDVTDFGRHFIVIDKAYRSLGKEKEKYVSG